MTVRQIHGLNDGTLRAFLDWDVTPGVRYTLQLTTDGRLIEWTARDETGLSSRRLRQAPIGRMERFVRQRMAEGAGPPATEATGVHVAYASQIAEWQQAWAGESRPSGTVLAVAAAYADAVARGEGRPIVLVADQLKLSETTIRNYVYKAREIGLLTSLGKGKAGGALTDKAKEILNGK